MLYALTMDDSSLAEAFSPLETRALADIQHETQQHSFMQAETGVVLQRFCDLRYRAQAYELQRP